MKTRKCQNRTEIDLLPPFGKPEVVTTGSQSGDVAVVGVIATAAIAYAARSK